MSLSEKFAWPKNTGEIISPVFQDIKGPKDEWGILVPHEGIRLLIRWVRDFIPNFHPEQEGLKWQQRCLGDWLRNSFYPIIYYHHETEEEVFLPELRKMGAQLDEKTEHEHADLLPRLKEVTHRLNEKGCDVEQWKKDAVQLFDDLEHHMNDEEKEFGPAVMAAGITEAQQKQVMEKLLASIPMNVMKMELPIMWYAMHTWFGESKEVSKFFKDDGMPAFVFWMANWSWIPHFFDDTVDRFTSLNNMGAPYKPAGWFTCSY